MGWSFKDNEKTGFHRCAEFMSSWCLIPHFVNPITHFENHPCRPDLHCARIMKRTACLLGISSFVFFCYCASSRTVAVVSPPSVNTLPAVTVTYSKHIDPLIITYCAPCHFPESDGKDGPLDNYDTVRAQINDIIYRIQLKPKERGYMPSKDKPLSDSVIRLLKDWKKQGLGR